LFEAPPPAPTPRPSAANLFINPGFEDGSQPWISPQQADWSPFSVSDSKAHDGTHSMRAQLEGDPNLAAKRSAGGSQEVRTGDFPEFVSGFYRVDSWQPRARFQYVEFVVRVRGGDFDDDVPTHEVRFLIGGTASDPPGAPGISLIYLSRGAPALGRWTYFSYPVKRAFESRFGEAPTHWDGMEVSFDVRYDGLTATEPYPAADVYFDDLYIGVQAGNPNRPPEP
jgi:hypothetical protein